MAVRHLFTIDEWHHMGATGLFGEDARVELLDGEVIEMAPIGSRHAGCVKYLARALIEAAGDRAVVAVQDPVVLNSRSEPQPDLAVLAPRADGYRDAHPVPSEILLLIEVADTTLSFDRDTKAPTYGRAGVPECWIVDLAGDQILVMGSPGGAGFEDVRQARRGEQVGLIALPGVVIDVAAVLGPSASAERVG
jgi:Uma2 family endonuclease